MDTGLFAAVDTYISERFAQEDEALCKTLVNMSAAGIPHWNISPVQGKLLQLLARMVGAVRILEVGTQGGYSATWLARALPGHGRLVTIEIDPLCADVAQHNFKIAGLADRIEIRIGNAKEVLPQLLAERQEFDMVFIDADKPPYAMYLDWAVKLCRPGGIIIADNVIRGGKVLDTAAADEAVAGVQRFNDALAADTRLQATIIQSVGSKEYDGMAIALVR